MKDSKSELKLVSTTPDDSAIRNILQNEAVLKYLSEVHRYPQEMPSTLHFKIEYNGAVIGEVALKTIKWFNRKAEVSIFLDPQYQGKGLGKQALLKLMDFAFHTMNLYRLEAEVVDYNEAAKKLFRKIGFVEEGRLREAKFYEGKYYDIIRYGLLRKEFEAQHASDS